MVRIDGSGGGNTIDPKAAAIGPKAETTEPSTTDEQAIAKAEQEAEEIGNFLMENQEFLDEAHYRQLLILQQTLTAAAQTLRYGGTGGSGGADGADGENWFEQPQALDPLWNGIPERNIKENDSYGLAVVKDDPDKYGEFEGTVIIPNSGTPANPTKFGFQMVSSDDASQDMEELAMESRGRDIVLTVSYRDGHKSSWVIREGTVRPEPIVVSAMGLAHGVTIDCSRVMRVQDGSYAGTVEGQRSGLYIHGSEYADDIKGTQSDDLIVGYKNIDGVDVIDGEAGNDTIYGDEFYARSGDKNEEYGGDDDIKGGAGQDIIYAGGGNDTVYSSDVDAVERESVDEHEFKVNDVADEAPDPGDPYDPTDGGWLDLSDDWEVVDSDAAGMLTIENASGNGGELTMTMPEGYSMAYGEQGSDGSLIITFVGEDETFKVKIVDFFSKDFGDGVDPATAVTRLTFKGNADNNIIDFSRCSVTSQVINILDEEGGDDIVLGAANALLADGVDVDELTKSQGQTKGGLKRKVNEGVFVPSDDEENEDGYNYTCDGYTSEAKNGQIVITADEDVPDDQRADRLSLKAPPGYDAAYVTSDADYIYVILVKRNAEGPADTIVYAIDRNLGLGYDDIDVLMGITEDGDTTYSDSLELTAISNEDDDYLIDPGDGHDLVFSPLNGRVNDDGEDDIVWITPPVEEVIASDLSSSSSSTKETKSADNDGGEDPEGAEE